jgi:hypothetical protein
MSIVKIWGGLGNQLFQYAFGQWLAQTNGESVSYVTKAGNSDFTGLKISHLQCVLNQPNMAMIGNLESYFNQQHRVKRKLYQLFPFLNHHFVVEATYPKQPEKFKQEQVFDGYWQNLTYLSNQTSTLLETFQFKDNRPYFASPYLTLIQSSKNAVCMHIRRGDFLTSNMHVQLPLSYYQLAIEEMNRSLVNPAFFVFSNDLSWVKENLQTEAKLFFVDHRKLEDADLFDFFLMQQCHHYIIANSSFSWWPAYLNQYQNKIVIAPKQWYQGKYNDMSLNILPGSWITL